MYSATVRYLGNRIISGALTYIKVITDRPDLKPEIDRYLTDRGREDLISQ